MSDTVETFFINNRGEKVRGYDYINPDGSFGGVVAETAIIATGVFIADTAVVGPDAKIIDKKVVYPFMQIAEGEKY